MRVVRATETKDIAIAPTTLPACTRSTVQPSGLPATSRRLRMRSGASLPDRRRATFEARPCSGAMIRSANDSSYSLVSSLGALVRACTRATERSTPLTVCPPGVVPIAAETRTMARSTRAPPRINNRVISHLDLHQAGHPEDAHGEDRDSETDHGQTQRPGEQHHHIFAVREQQVEHEPGRQPAQHVGGEL